MTPTARTLAHYREQGWIVEVTERWNPHARVRHDLFGFADMLAFDADWTVAIQCTTTKNLNDRIRKAAALDTFAKWLAHPRRQVHFVGWTKYKQSLDGRFWRPTVRVLHALEEVG